MSFLSGVRDLISWATTKADNIKNLKKEDVTAAARKASAAGMSVLCSIQCNCLDVLWGPQGEAHDFVENEEPVKEGADEPGWEMVPKEPPHDDLSDPYPAADNGVKRRRKKGS